MQRDKEIIQWNIANNSYAENFEVEPFQAFPVAGSFKNLPKIKVSKPWNFI